MVKVIGVQRVIMRGGFKVMPGVEMELPEDVADDAVRAGFASYADYPRMDTNPGQGAGRTGARMPEAEVSDEGADVDAVQPGEGAKAGAGRGRRS